MDFRYKGFDVNIDKNMMGYFVWDASNKKDDYLADNEGGDLGNMKNAKFTIKKWINDFLRDPISFQIQQRGLTVKIGLLKII